MPRQHGFSQAVLCLPALACEDIECMSEVASHNARGSDEMLSAVMCAGDNWMQAAEALYWPVRKVILRQGCRIVKLLSMQRLVFQHSQRR